VLARRDGREQACRLNTDCREGGDKSTMEYTTPSRLGGVVVSVLAGFVPGQGDGFLRAIKIRSTPSFGWEIKREVPML
jgi:hypothetical protein